MSFLFGYKEATYVISKQIHVSMICFTSDLWRFGLVVIFVL